MSREKVWDYIKTVSAIGKKIQKVKKSYDKIKHLRDYAERLLKKDRNSVTPEDLKYFKNETMEEVLAELRAIEDDTTSVFNTKLTVPDSGRSKLIDAASRVVAKKGTQHRDTQSAVKYIEQVLRTHHKQLWQLSIELDAAASQELPENERIMQELAKAGYIMREAFLDLTKIAFPGLGTEPNAKFHSLAMDAQRLGATARTVATNFSKIAKMSKEFIKEVDKAIEVNERWIDWAVNDALAKDDTLKKNKNASEPKR